MFHDTPQGTTQSQGETAYNKPMSEITALLQSLDELKERILVAYEVETNRKLTNLYHQNLAEALPTIHTHIERLEREAEAGRVLATMLETIDLKCLIDSKLDASSYLTLVEHCILQQKQILTTYRTATQDLISK